MLETQRFIDAHGLNKFVFNPHFPINTITLMRGFIAAKEMGVVEQYVEANLSARGAGSIWDPEVAAGVAVCGV